MGDPARYYRYAKECSRIALGVARGCFIYCILFERNLRVFEFKRKRNIVIKEKILLLVRHKLVIIPKVRQKMRTGRFVYALAMGNLL